MTIRVWSSPKILETIVLIIKSWDIIDFLFLLFSQIYPHYLNSHASYWLCPLIYWFPLTLLTELLSSPPSQFHAFQVTAKQRPSFEYRRGVDNFSNNESIMGVAMCNSCNSSLVVPVYILIRYVLVACDNCRVDFIEINWTMIMVMS